MTPSQSQQRLRQTMLGITAQSVTEIHRASIPQRDLLQCEADKSQYNGGTAKRSLNLVSQRRVSSGITRDHP